MPANRKWFLLLSAAVVAAILFASLAPVGWQMRLGLHWLVEHFLVYFALTTLLCLAWPRPMMVAAVLVPFAVLLEVAQAMTPETARLTSPRRSAQPQECQWRRFSSIWG